MSEICPYCRGIPKVGDDPVSIPRTPFDEVLYETAQFVLVPTLGMIVPGCFLIISKKHLDSFACMESQTLSNIERQLKKIINWLEPIFGEYLIFEHGGLASQNKPHGGCITHAHFHLFPTAKETGLIVQRSLSWKSIDLFSNLSGFRDSSYAFLGLNRKYYVHKTPNLPSQWIRRIVVDSLNISKHWDWGVEFGYEELEITLAKIK